MGARGEHDRALRDPSPPTPRRFRVAKRDGRSTQKRNPLQRAIREKPDRLAIR